MSIYLGETTIINDFVNFKPYYEYENGRFSLLTRFDRQTLLPESELENLNFYSSDPNVIVKDLFHSHEYCLFEFKTDELEPNENPYTHHRNRTGYRVDISNLPKGKLLSLADVGIYRLIKADQVSGNYLTNSILTINDDLIFEGQQVVIEIAGNTNDLLGPFKITYRQVDDVFIVKTSDINSKYIIPAFTFPNGYSSCIHTFGIYENEQQYIQIADQHCEKHSVDVLPKELLIKGFLDTLSSDVFENGRLNLTNIEEAVNLHTSSVLVGEGIPRSIQQKRLADLRTFLTDEENLNDTFDFIGQAIAALLIKYKDSDTFDPIMQRMADDADFMSQIQRFEIINERIAEKEAELLSYRQQLESLRQQKEAEEASVAAHGIIEGYEEEINQKKSEIGILQAEIESLHALLSVAREGAALQDRLAQLTEDVDYKEKRERELDTKLKIIDEKLDGIFSNSTEKAMSFAFDGMLSSRMLQTAADWELGQKQQDYVSVVEKVRALEIEEMNQDEIVEYLCSQVNKYRPLYGKNVILNAFICIAQGFLTVFSGEPGAGKTSMCNIIANTLGLTLPKEKISTSRNGVDPNRYVSVSVERGWTSKRDFIGYYNPLSKQFDRSNRRLFDAINILNIEAENVQSDLPFLTLLDEANLSPMEYYWADFMNICDDLSANSTINLGEDYCFRIPEHLRFVATINNDHTTEELSPRLIDRAWVVKLPIAKSGTAKTTKLDFEGVKIIPWASFVDAFSVTDENATPLSNAAKEIYDAVLGQLKSAHITVSSRVDSAVRRYWAIAQAVFEDELEYGADASIVALDYAIAQRILPHINGGGDAFGEALRSLAKLCAERNLRISADVLNEIIRKGDDTMFYYKYFS